MNPTSIILILVMISAGCTYASRSGSDTTPPADALPMAPGPIQLDRILGDDEWAGARIIDDSFVIADGSPRDGAYPFKLRLMADRMNLYVAIQVWNLTPNEVQDPYSIKADHISLYLSADEDELERPSDWIDVASLWEQGSGLSDGYWNGQDWVLQDYYEPNGRFNEGHPLSGRWARTGADRENETQWWEIHIPRASTIPEVDGFRVPEAGAFRMAVGLMLEPLPGEPEGTPIDAHGDTYPGAGATPEVVTQPAQWLRLSLR